LARARNDENPDSDSGIRAAEEKVVELAISLKERVGVVRDHSRGLLLGPLIFFDPELGFKPLNPVVLHVFTQKRLRKELFDVIAELLFLAFDTLPVEAKIGDRVFAVLRDGRLDNFDFVLVREDLRQRRLIGFYLNDQCNCGGLHGGGVLDSAPLYTISVNY
jgi:hypothetical protein